ncbi:NrfD/PsrC family molybdoenzyme membrane anchor subunit [Pelagicoccus sp. SDUM812003]|uniref:NrfD/PsrC family molybdoenzyme membrane anchor subunit n=1 Tax=Pelagicoccus sp. SDUM812003 TaxID=3041267 RepID=UPI00280F3559|nr:NrfD/PsrC family molybdoenzyme membrane anchor subunit [Pelagicoccus sp. SDUM812003]MDQ8202975.1 polysulfide reductase NrfD [Pelagicoccus sp. SDUM812003]
MASASSHSHEARPAILEEVNPVDIPRQPCVANDRSFNWITEKVCGIIEEKTPTWWWVCFIIACCIASFTVVGLVYLTATGVGVWGLANPVNWGWAIVNFVFWIGIGHAGTLISAILCLLRQKWRTSINRAAEAMTIFAVVCAGLFPVFHVGRVWFALYPGYLFPFPNANAIWPNFRSALLWDVFAVSTYGTVSVLFWYIGLIPDFATVRDRAKSKIRKIAYGIVAMGWRGSNRHWSNYEMLYLLLAGLSTPLVLSVHTIVSFDFAISLVPGWHTTIFPPYFVAGAIFSGFGMVLTLMLPLRAVYGLQDLITQYHIDCMTKIVLATGTMVGYAYGMEFFIAAYGANDFEIFAFVNRAFGNYAWAYWIMISCNVISPQFFWFKKIRENTTLVWVISIFVNVGMWFERFVITVTSLSRDFLPSSWGYYSPTVVDIFTYLGTFGLFSVLFLLFLRFVPLMAMAEIKAVTPQADPHHH